MPNILQVTVQCGSQQIILNDQYLQISDIVDRSDHPSKFVDDVIMSKFRQVLCIDLSGYGWDLDNYGSSSGGATSVTVAIQFGSGVSTGQSANSNRTLPYQAVDWNATNL